MANSHITVIGHCGQKKTFGSKQRYIEEYLASTASHGDGLVPREKVEGHLGHCSTDEHKIHEGELAEKDVHGSVELGIQVDEKHHSRITHEGQEEDTQDKGKEKSMKRAVIKNTQQDEIRVEGPIVPLHHKYVHCGERI